jgi:hypothetical protein
MAHSSFSVRRMYLAELMRHVPPVCGIPGVSISTKKASIAWRVEIFDFRQRQVIQFKSTTLYNR